LYRDPNAIEDEELAELMKDLDDELMDEEERKR